MLHATVLSLNSRVENVADFVAVVRLPLRSRKPFVELSDCARINKVDESITHVCFTFLIDWQVKEVVSVLEVLVTFPNLFFEFHLWLVF